MQAVLRSPAPMIVRVGLSFVLVGCLATAVHADDHSLHVTGFLQAGWTDNLLSSPDEPREGAPEKTADFYAQFRPGVLGAWARGRMILQASYELEANLYAENDEASSFQHVAGVDAFFLTSPRTELTTGVRLSTGELNSFQTRAPAAGGGYTITESGSTEFRSAEVSQLLAFTATRELRLTQSLRARYFSSENVDVDPPSESSGTDLQLEGAADRSFRYSAVSLRVTGNLNSLQNGADADLDGEVDAPSRQLNAGVVGAWRRDFGLRWTLALDAGATAVIPFQDVSPSIQPTIGAQLGYFPEWGSAGVSIRRSVAPNLFIQENTITDSAIVNAWLPLPWFTPDPMLPRFSVAGSAGITRTQVISRDTGEPTGAFDMLGADAALNYHPMEGFVVTARYQYLDQRISEAGDAAVFPYSRHTVMISVGGRFPYRLAAEVPQRETLRVDRRNATPVGEEVAPTTAPGAGGGGGSGGTP